MSTRKRDPEQLAQPVNSASLSRSLCQGGILGSISGFCFVLGASCIAVEAPTNAGADPSSNANLPDGMTCGSQGNVAYFDKNCVEFNKEVMSMGMILGISIGSGCAVLLILAITCVVCVRQRRKKKQQAIAEQSRKVIILDKPVPEPMYCNNQNTDYYEDLESPVSSDDDYVKSLKAQGFEPTTPAPSRVVSLRSSRARHGPSYARPDYSHRHTPDQRELDEMESGRVQDTSHRGFGAFHGNHNSSHLKTLPATNSSARKPSPAMRRKSDEGKFARAAIAGRVGHATSQSRSHSRSRPSSESASDTEANPYHYDFDPTPRSSSTVKKHHSRRLPQSRSRRDQITRNKQSSSNEFDNKFAQPMTTRDRVEHDMNHVHVMDACDVAPNAGRRRSSTSTAPSLPHHYSNRSLRSPVSNRHSRRFDQSPRRRGYHDYH